MCKLKTLILGVVFVLGIVVPAQASLIGDEVVVNSPQPCDPCDFLVVEGLPEQNLLSNTLSLNVEASSFEITHLLINGTTTLGPSADPLDLIDLDWVNDPNATITGVTLASTTNMSGLEQGDLSFTDHGVTVNWENVNFMLASGFLVTIQTAPHVPTPSAMLLMSTGLLGLIGWRMWSSKTT